MAALDRCFETLRPLIAESQIAGIPLAKGAIDQCLAEVAPPARRGALQDLQAFVRNHQKASGAGSVQSAFTEVVGDYLAKRAWEL
jgi:hypothetical protein